MQPQILLPPGSACAAALPRRVAARGADLVGSFADLISGPHSAASQALRANLASVGHHATPGLLREIRRTYARYYVEFMRLSKLPAEDAVGRVELRNARHLDESRSRGRGALVLSAHFGNWDLVGIALARAYGGVTALAERLRPEALFEFYRTTRTRHGMRVVAAGDRDRTPIETLRDNGVIALLGDRVFGRRFARVPFGNAWLDVPTGALRLAVRKGAGVHAAFAIRGPNGYEVCLSEDLHPLQTALSADDAHACVVEAAHRFAAQLANVVRAHPEQWCMLRALTCEHQPTEVAAASREASSQRSVQGAA